MLKTLDISSNPISNKGISELVKLKTPALSRLKICDLYLTEDILKVILKVASPLVDVQFDFRTLESSKVLSYVLKFNKFYQCTDKSYRFKMRIKEYKPKEF